MLQCLSLADCCPYRGGGERVLDGGSEVAAAIGVTSARGAVPACPSARDGATNGLRSRPSKDCNETIPAFVDTQYHCLNARDPTSRPTCAATTYRTTTTPPPPVSHPRACAHSPLGCRLHVQQTLVLFVFPPPSRTVSAVIDITI